MFSLLKIVCKKNERLMNFTTKVKCTQPTCTHFRCTSLASQCACLRYAIIFRLTKLPYEHKKINDLDL